MSDKIFDVILKNNSKNEQKAMSALMDDNLRSSATPSIFWRPSYLAPSAWVEHVPFAFWLAECLRPQTFVELGTHYGVSYFAFCQAVQRLELNTKCFAIDTWKGDEHSGSYTEAVYEKVAQHNDAQYSDFSRLVRSSFDEALKHFENGSIDLLHIDGLHTYEAVLHDFESWLPKLSAKAVVIMHDTNVRERGFGVFKLFSQLKEKYPHFEFSHGHGLGMLGVGSQQKDALINLYEINHDSPAHRSICEVFGRLGRACADTQSLQQAEIKSKSLSSDLEKNKKLIDGLKEELDKNKSELRSKSKELNDINTRLSFGTEKQALERGQLVEKINFYKENKDQLIDEISIIKERISKAELDIAEREKQLLLSNEAKNTLLREIELTKEQVTGIREENKYLHEQVARLNVDLTNEKQALDMKRRAASDVSAENLMLQKELMQVKSELQISLYRHEEKDKSEIEGLGARLDASREEIKKLQEKINSDGDAAKSIYSEELNRIKVEAASLKLENQKLVKSIDERFKEIANFTKILESKNIELEEVNNQASANKKILDEQVRELGHRTNVINELSELLTERDKTIAEYSSELEHRLAIINYVNATLAERDSWITESRAEIEAKQRQIEAIEKMAMEQTLEQQMQSEAKINEISAECDFLRQSLQATYESTSWRVTAPMRKLKGLGSLF